MKFARLVSLASQFLQKAFDPVSALESAKKSTKSTTTIRELDEIESLYCWFLSFDKILVEQEKLHQPDFSKQMQASKAFNDAYKDLLLMLKGDYDITDDIDFFLENISDSAYRVYEETNTSILTRLYEKIKYLELDLAKISRQSEAFHYDSKPSINKEIETDEENASTSEQVYEGIIEEKERTLEVVNSALSDQINRAKSNKDLAKQVWMAAMKRKNRSRIEPLKNDVPLKIGRKSTTLGKLLALSPEDQAAKISIWKLQDLVVDQPKWWLLAEELKLSDLLALPPAEQKNVMMLRDIPSSLTIVDNRWGDANGPTINQVLDLPPEERNDVVKDWRALLSAKKSAVRKIKDPAKAEAFSSSLAEEVKAYERAMYEIENNRHNEYMSAKVKNETDEQRSARLRSKKVFNKKYLAKETEEQRAARIKYESDKNKQRRARLKQIAENSYWAVPEKTNQ